MSLPKKVHKSGAEAAMATLRNHSASELRSRMLERRAVEAVIWGMPAVNFDLLYRAMNDVGGAWNQIVCWSRLPDWKNQTLTPNPDVIYVFPFFDTKDAGPMVMEIPPVDDGSITGSIDDAWQNALEDVGPAGADSGKGGKYLVLPPGYGETPPEGYIAVPSDTYRSYAILRSNLASGSDTDIAKALAYGKRVRVYPLSQAKKPPATQFVDAVDTVYDSTIPYDVRFFESLARFVEHEPWLTRDKAMINTLGFIGIAKGKSFAPDDDTKSILTAAAQEARAWLDLGYEAVFSPPYYQGSHWALPANKQVVEGMPTLFSDPNAYPVDGRGVTYSMAYFSAKHLGTGQFYLMTIKDNAGHAFDGKSGYRLRIPTNPPVSLYWSATAYDRATHALIRDQKHSSRSSHSPGLQTNTDGSTDVYFGPKPPPGKEANWVPTSANGQFEVLFRFYGPEKPLFDKSWILPDIERIP
jgi:hypothetical protein